MTADPSSKYSSCINHSLNQAHDRHYVSELYDPSENPPLNPVFSSGRHCSLESLRPIASTASYRTGSPRLASTMNFNIPQNTNYGYTHGNSPVHDLVGVLSSLSIRDGSDFCCSTALL